MIGRGIKLCKDLLGIGIDKEEFLIFDFCNNFEFFRANPKEYESKNVETLTEKLFNVKVDMIRELQDLKYSDNEYVSYRNNLLKDVFEDVSSLHDESFRVRMNLKYVHKYKNKEMWNALSTITTNEIKEHISPLITPFNDDELAKRFDMVMYTIQLANLQGNNATKPIKSVIDTAEALSKKSTIPEVKAQKYIIDKVRTKQFWEDVDIFELDGVREALRNLIKYIDRNEQRIYYTKFNDMIISEESYGAMYNANDLKNYRKKQNII